METVTCDPGTVARCELDTHADTCVAGPNFQLDEYTGDHCDVTPYSTEYQPLKNVPIVNASTAFTDPKTGRGAVFGASGDARALAPDATRAGLD